MERGVLAVVMTTHQLSREGEVTVDLILLNKYQHNFRVTQKN